MKELNMEQMENVIGGDCNQDALAMSTIIGAAACLGAALPGVINTVILGPTCWGTTAAGTVCAIAHLAS